MAQPGDTVEVYRTITNNGIRVDPTTLTLTVTSPTAVVTTYTYPTSANLTRVETGKYQAALSVNAAGIWQYTWTSTVPNSTFTSEFSVSPLFESVTYTVTNAVGGAAIANVLLEFFGSADDIAPRATARTDGSGHVTVRLLPGTYRVEGQKAKAAPLRTTITVANTNGVTPQSFASTMSVYTINNPVAAQVCRIFGFMVDSLGVPLRGVQVMLTTVGMGWNKPFVNGQATGIDPLNQGVATQWRTLSTNGDGYWETDVPVGALLRVRVPVIYYDKIFRVPEETTLNIKDARTDALTMDTGITNEVPYTGGFAGNPQ